MSKCAWCEDDYKRLTRCPECKAMLCQFDYATHKRARENGDGCLFAMMARIQRIMGVDDLTLAQYLQAIERK